MKIIWYTISCELMRPWRNWQTRKIKDLVRVIRVEVRIFLAALLYRMDRYAVVKRCYTGLSLYNDSDETGYIRNKK